jgi:hypothetical protein
MTVVNNGAGLYCAVTEDSPPLRYASILAPTPGMDVIAQDIIDLSQVVMNVQARSIDGYGGGTYPLGANVIITSASGNGFAFALGGFVSITQGGSLLLEGNAQITSGVNTAWGGTYPYGAATFVYDMTTKTAGQLLIGDGASLPGSHIYQSGSSGSWESGSTFYLKSGVTTSISTPLLCYNNGRVTYTYAEKNAGYDYDANNVPIPSLIRVNPGAATVTIKLPGAGTGRNVVGQRVRVTMEEEANDAGVCSVDTNPGTWSLQNKTGYICWQDFQWDGSAWRLAGHGRY